MMKKKSFILLIFIFTTFFLSISFDIPILIFKLALFSGITFTVLNKKQITTNKILADLLILIGLTSVFLVFSSVVNQEIITYKPFFILGLIVVIGYAIGTLIKIVKVQDVYKTALILGLLMLIIESESRRFGEGWFAVGTMLGFISGAAYLSGIKTEVKPAILWILLIIPTLLLNLIFSPLFGKSLIFPVLTLAFILSYFIIAGLNLVGMNLIRKNVFLVLAILLSGISWFLQENYATLRYTSTNTDVDFNIDYDFISLDGDAISNTDNSGKVVVNLFWSAYCGRCASEYPEFSKLAHKFKERDDVKFYGVFISFSERDSSYFNKVVKQEFEFDWVKADQGAELYSDLQINGVPHLSVFDKEGNVIYNGWVRNRPWILVNKPERIIQRLLD